MLTKEKIFRIGIDKISLYNFSLKTDKKFKTLTDTKENYVKEKTIISDELFSIISSYTIYQNDNKIEESYYNKLTFNPNKILTGDNICNSTVEDFQAALKKLKEILFSMGIEIDFSQAKIADIEINLNVPVDFENYSQVFMLFFKQLSNAKAISAITQSQRAKYFKIDESFFARLSKKSTFKVYSKDREKKLATKITRLEYYFEDNSYKYLAEKFGADNTINTLSDNLIQEIFRYKATKDFIKKSFTYLEEELKPLLEREYLAFKQANKLARISGKKEERNVYKYLEQFWIFDNSFLIELIEKYDAVHKSREINRIITKYNQYDNLKKLNYMLELILTTKTN